MAMRHLLFSLLCLESARDHLEESTSLSSVLSVLENDFNNLLLVTARAKLGLDVDSVKVNLKGVELSMYQDDSTSYYRKTIGLFVYLLKAMGYLSTEGSSKFKLTKHLAPLRDQLSETITETKKTAFAKHLAEVGLE
jgi:hypothetical protein